MFAMDDDDNDGEQKKKNMNCEDDTQNKIAVPVKSEIKINCKI